MKNTLLLRAEGNRRIGTGHVMRCLALGQAWIKAGGNVIFLSCETDAPLLDRLRQSGIAVKEDAGLCGLKDGARRTVEIAEEVNASWVVLDGYDFTEEHQRAIKAAGLKLCVYDDNVDYDSYCADLIVNQNSHANESIYRGKLSEASRLLLGPKYAVLREEFLMHERFSRVYDRTPVNVLVTMGGSDPDNITKKAMEALSLMNSSLWRATIVVGSANHHFKSLQTMPIVDGDRVVLKKGVENMSSLMADSDIAVMAGGTTCWEVLFMMLPALIVVLADNQVRIADALAEKELALTAGWGDEIDPGALAEKIELLMEVSIRRKLGERGRRCVDGAGGSRIVQAMKAVV